MAADQIFNQIIKYGKIFKLSEKHAGRFAGRNSTVHGLCCQALSDNRFFNG